MKLIQCVDAYAAAVALAECECEYKTAYALVKLKRKLQHQVDFYSEQENKLMEEYAAKDENGRIEWVGPGKVQLKDTQAAEVFVAKRKELGEVDVDEEFKPMRVPAPKCIKPVHLEALDGFIVFDEGGGEE